MLEQPYAPVTVHRACGGWLAIAPPASACRFAVTADTEEQAVERFWAADEKWRAPGAVENSPPL